MAGLGKVRGEGRQRGCLSVVAGRLGTVVVAVVGMMEDSRWFVAVAVVAAWVRSSGFVVVTVGYIERNLWAEVVYRCLQAAFPYFEA